MCPVSSQKWQLVSPLQFKNHKNQLKNCATKLCKMKTSTPNGQQQGTLKSFHNEYGSMENYYPSPYCPNTVINSWANSKESNTGIRARAIVKQRNIAHPKRALYDYNIDLTVLTKCIRRNAYEK
jgi:hypothetical protein